MHRVPIALVAALLASAVHAAPRDATARALLTTWKAEDPRARLAAELIAGAFASGLSWGGKLGGKEVFCPPDGLTGRQIMTAFEQFIAEAQDMADNPMALLWPGLSAVRFLAQRNEIGSERQNRPHARKPARGERPREIAQAESNYFLDCPRAIAESFCADSLCS